MQLKITKETPIFSGKPEFQVSDLKKKVVMVEFPNCISTKTNKPFKWCPTYEQLIEIRHALNEIEEESWENAPEPLKSQNSSILKTQ